MDNFVGAVLSELSASLTALTVKGTVTAVSTKIKAIQYKKDIEAVRNSYDEIVNELLSEREEAVRIAQIYKSELDRYQISDDDINHLHATVGRVAPYRVLQRWYKGGKVGDNQTLPRNPALKRTQKGRKDERTGRGRPAVNGIELRNLGNCRILPKVCACLKATSVAASRRVVIGGPESKAHSREPSCQQGNQ